MAKPEQIEKAIEMRRQGATIKEVMEATGLAKGTIQNYTAGEYRRKEKTKSVFTYYDQVRWVKAVNRIRKAMGKKPFPKPYPPID